MGDTASEERRLRFDEIVELIKGKFSKDHEPLVSEFYATAMADLIEESENRTGELQSSRLKVTKG